jgi:transmembrane protein
MTMTTPAWVSAILDSAAFRVASRILLTTPFWAAGLQHAAQWSLTLGEMEHFGLRPPALYGVLTILTCLVGSALTIPGGRWTWLGAGLLGVFTALTIPIAHAFWALTGDAMMGELRTVMEHVSIIGGLMVLAYAQNGKPRAA